MAVEYKHAQVGRNDLNYVIGSASNFAREKSDGTTQTIDRISPTDVRYWDDLNAAITAIGANNIALLIPTAQTLTANITIPKNVELIFCPGAIITLDGYNFTCNGTITTGLYKIFTWVLSDGNTMDINNSFYVCPQCWGAYSDGTNGDITFDAIKQAMSINQTADQKKPTILFPSGTYATDDTLTVGLNNIHLMGAFQHARENANDALPEIKYTGSDEIIKEDNILIEGLHINGSDTASYGIYTNGSTIRNCRIEACLKGIGLCEGDDNKVYDNYFVSNPRHLEMASTNVKNIDIVSGNLFDTSTNYDIEATNHGTVLIKNNRFYNANDKNIIIKGNGKYVIDSNSFQLMDNYGIHVTTDATDPQVDVINNHAFEEAVAVTFCYFERGHLRFEGNSICGYTGSAGMSKTLDLRDGFRHVFIGSNIIQTADEVAGRIFSIETSDDVMKVEGIKDFVWSYRWEQATGDTTQYIPVYGCEAEEDYVKRQYFIRNVKAIVIAALTDGGTNPSFSIGYDILGGADDDDYYATDMTIDPMTEGGVTTMDTYVDVNKRSKIVSGFADDNKVIEFTCNVEDWSAGGPVLFMAHIGCVEFSVRS